MTSEAWVSVITRHSTDVERVVGVSVWDALDTKARLRHHAVHLERHHVLRFHRCTVASSSLASSAATSFYRLIIWSVVMAAYSVQLAVCLVCSGYISSATTECVWLKQLGTRRQVRPGHTGTKVHPGHCELSRQYITHDQQNVCTVQPVCRHITSAQRAHSCYTLTEVLYNLN